MRYSELYEGFRYGNKQQNEVLSDLNNFSFGIEIELQHNDDTENSGIDPSDIITYVLENPAIEIHPNDSGILAHAIQHNTAIDFNGIYSPGHRFFTTYFYEKILRDGRKIDDSDTDQLMANAKLLMTTIKRNEALSSFSDIPLLHHGISTIIGSLTPISVLGIMYHNFGDAYLDTISSGSNSITTGLGASTHVLYRALTNLNDMIKTFPASLLELDTIDEDTFTDAHAFEYHKWLGTPPVYNYLDRIFQFKEHIENVGMDNPDDYLSVIPSGNFITHDLIEFVVKHSIDEYIDLEDMVSELLNITASDDEFENIVTAWANAGPTLTSAVSDEISPVHDFEQLIEIAVDELNITYDFIGTREQDNQLEVILETPVSGNDIIHAYNDAFELITYLNGKGFHSSTSSGLHMSISYLDGSMEFDTTMFAVVSNTYQAVVGASEHVRSYVESMYEFLEDNIMHIGDAILDSIDASSPIVGDYIIDYVKRQLSDKRFDALLGAKFKSVNFQHYYTSNGRVELRYFGGTGYEKRKDEYFDELIRSMYSLKMSMVDPTTGKGFAYKEYLHTLYRMTNKIFNTKFGLSISDFIDNVNMMTCIEKVTHLSIVDHGSIIGNLSQYSELVHDNTADTDKIHDYDNFLSNHQGENDMMVVTNPRFRKVLGILVDAYRQSLR